MGHTHNYVLTFIIFTLVFTQTAFSTTVSFRNIVMTVLYGAFLMTVGLYTTS